jgi:hypothetical protein
MPGSWFGSNNGATEEKKDTLQPTQSHMLANAVQDGVAIIRLAVNKVPTTTLTAVLEVGALDITRMAEPERRAFLSRYTEALRAWRFPYQIVIGRRQQQLDEFMERGSEQLARWRSQRQPERAELLGRLLDFMERVTVYANPQVPVYYVALPYAVPTQVAQAGRVNQSQYRDGLQTVADRCRIVQQSLNQLGLGVIRLDDQAIVDMLYAFYHPSLPVLWLPPEERIASLLVSGEESIRE